MAASKRSSLPKDFGKLILQLIWFNIILIPMLLWAFLKKITPSRKKSLRGEVVLITGAGNGLGKELALRMAKKGCKLALVDINAEAVQNVTNQINKEHENAAKSYVANLGKPQDIKTLAEQIFSDFQKVDILINNAALVFAGCKMVDLRDQEIDGVLQVNVASHFRMIREFLPSMLERNHGHVVAISSGSAYAAAPNSSTYVSSKWAVTGMMQCLRDELREIPNNNVKISMACPFFFSSNTDITPLWDIRMPPLSTKQVANATIDGIQKNKFEFTIPGYQYFIFHLVRLVPDSVRDRFASIFYTRIKTLSELERDKLSSIKIIESINNK